MTDGEKEEEEVVKEKRWGRITQLSQSGELDEGGGGELLFQLGESNHLISSNCNESILSGEERRPKKWKEEEVKN